jgi:hypothetical protein
MQQKLLFLDGLGTNYNKIKLYYFGFLLLHLRCFSIMNRKINLVILHVSLLNRNIVTTSTPKIKDGVKKFWSELNIGSVFLEDE